MSRRPSVRNLSGMLALSVMTAGFLLPAAAVSQVVEPRSESDWCGNRSGDRGQERVCEVREVRLASTGRLEVNAGANGGITVQGWDGSDVLVRVRVEAMAGSATAARSLLERVEILTEGGRVRPEGPRTERREHWSTSFEVWVPRRMDLELRSVNGGIRVADVSGAIGFQATNGGVTLDRLAGDVRGTTTNGGLRITLAGNRWEGQGLEARSTNGGVRLTVPDGYSAELEAGATNGGVQVDFPITVQGRLGRRITATLGEGGAPIRVSTTNGGVRVGRN